MKKIFAVVCLLSLLIVPASFAASAESSGTYDPVEENAYVYGIDENGNEYADGIYNTDPNNIGTMSNPYGIQPLASVTGLINGTNIRLTKSGSQLAITGQTLCASGITKSGFTEVKLQRKVNGSWSNYATWTDQYSSSTSFTFSKGQTVPSGYYYRVVCTHYAEKPFLIFLKDTQTIYNETGELYY